MSPLLSLALQHGGWEERGIRVPAAQLLAFLTDAHAQSVNVTYIECLYVAVGSTEPSMELSAQPSQFSTWDEFVSFASAAVEKAIFRASTGDCRRASGPAEAVFEVGH